MRFKEYISKQDENLFGWGGKKDVRGELAGNIAGSAGDAYGGASDVVGGISAAMGGNPIGLWNAMQGMVKTYQAITDMSQAIKNVTAIQRRYSELKKHFAGRPESQVEQVLTGVFSFDLKLKEYFSPAVLKEAIGTFAQEIQKATDPNSLSATSFSRILSRVIDGKADEARSIAERAQSMLTKSLGVNLGDGAWSAGRDDYIAGRGEESYKKSLAVIQQHFPPGTSVAVGQGDWHGKLDILGKVVGYENQQGQPAAVLDLGSNVRVKVNAYNLKYSRELAVNELPRYKIGTQRYLQQETE